LLFSEIVHKTLWRKTFFQLWWKIGLKRNDYYDFPEPLPVGQADEC
jgi:hypothetical protein